jgi:hypothetical protein
VGNGDDRYRLSLQAKVKDLELKNYISEFSNSAGVNKVFQSKKRNKLLLNPLFNNLR